MSAPAPADDPTAIAVRTAILDAFGADPKTRDPMNAMIVWTELGRALQGTLQRKGGDPGLLRRVIAKWCRSTASTTASTVAGTTSSLDRWAYRVEPDQRLTPTELAAALRRVQSACESVLVDLARAGGDDGGRAVFVACARGWFPAGLHIVSRLAAPHAATETQVIEAMGAWCERFLPDDPTAGKDLGVYVTRS